MKRPALAALFSALLAAPVAAQPPAGPVRIEETGRSPDGPLSPTDAAYDERLRASMASAQAFQGPLAGGWTLAGGGRELFAFELTDRNGVAEGAWRDLRRSGALDASGFLDQAERAEGGVTFRFDGRLVVLRRDFLGRWVGELTEDGHIQVVSLSRKTP